MDSDDCGDWAICDGVYVVEDVAEAARKISWKRKTFAMVVQWILTQGDCDCISECGGVFYAQTRLMMGKYMEEV